jgi:RNA polymerase sigma-70 factor (ECF subfamily)
MQNYSPTFIPAPLRIPVLADDQDLLLRAAQDDSEAFQKLFDRHRDGLQGFLFRKLRSYEDAEDAVTLTFCNAWRARQTFRGNSSGKAWLYRIATHVALDMLRARRRRPVEQELDLLQPDLVQACHEQEEPVDPETLVLGAERMADTQNAVHAAMNRLPGDERQLLHLFYFDGYDYDQISSMLGVSRSQVRGRLHRIRGRVRRDLMDRQCWNAAIA